DLELDRGAFFIPDAVAVGAFDAKSVIATVKICISCDAARAAVVPIWIKPHQLIGVLILLRSAVIERGKLKRENIVAIRQLNLISLIERFRKPDLLIEQIESR